MQPPHNETTLSTASAYSTGSPRWRKRLARHCRPATSARKADEEQKAPRLGEEEEEEDRLATQLAAP
jgi:hypothetical protein